MSNKDFTIKITNSNMNIAITVETEEDMDLVQNIIDKRIRTSLQEKE